MGVSVKRGISIDGFSLKQASGFTLIEMMVSVAIFGAMAAIIFPALIQFLDARDRLDQKHAQIVSMQKTFLFLAQDIRFAANRLTKDEFGQLSNSTLRVNDDDNLIEFTALYPDLNLNGLGVPRRVKWVLKDAVLQRVQYPVIDPDQDTRIIKQNLMQDVRRIDIKLMHVVDGRNIESDSWESESSLPDMLEVVVELESGLEYRRALAMLSGDKVTALAATINANPNVGQSGETGDDGVSNESGEP